MSVRCAVYHSYRYLYTVSTDLAYDTYILYIYKYTQRKKKHVLVRRDVNQKYLIEVATEKNIKIETYCTVLLPSLRK